MAKTRREVLKFIRINTRPSHVASDSNNKTVYGYLNKWSEFTKYDEEQPPWNTLSTAKKLLYSSNNVRHPAPFRFFNKPPQDEDYKSMVFVIDGITAPYDRAIHNLNTLSSTVYIQQSNGDLIHWDPSFGSNTIKYSGALTTPSSLSFKVNPNNIKIDKKKLFKKIRTRGGWVFQHWGPEIGNIKISGTTGNLSPDAQNKKLTSILPDEGGAVRSIDINRTLNARPSVKNSPTLEAFSLIEKWYDEDQNDESINNGDLTALQFRDRIYVGHLSDFSFEEKGDQPFQFLYTLNFVVHYDATDLNAATTKASNQISRNEETLDLVRQLKGI